MTYFAESYRRRETACGKWTASSKHFRACANFQRRCSLIEEKYYERSLINIIKFACNSCPEKRDCLDRGCRWLSGTSLSGGLSQAGYPWKTAVCDRSEKCIKCGKCLESCPYNAIIKQERPCAKACGMNAIHSDEYGRAEIDYDKCVSCGMCLVSCPFSAIVDKGQIYQTIMALKSDTPVYAIVAPAVAGQFEPELKNTQLRGAFKALGLRILKEVAVGADLCTIEEAKDFMKEVPEDSVYGNLMLSGMVCYGKRRFHSLPTAFPWRLLHGTDCQTSEAGRARLQDRVSRTMCSQEAGGKP